MKYHTLFAVTLLVSEIFQGACAKKVVPPPPPPSGIISGDSDRLQESLFKGDQAVLSNQDIEKILGAQITIADRHRLAILSLNSRSWYDESLTDAEAQNADHLIEVLKSSPQLSQVRFMPSLLIPEKRTVPYLREASARFQADLLLVYTTRIQSFRQNRLLGSDEVRA
ncbi:MAG TPA: hypothetical protein VE398_18640, partial [Acidobacteriota bacterium]|nr:hypothetical protein [Acidobacteriota bacterium]